MTSTPSSSFASRLSKKTKLGLHNWYKTHSAVTLIFALVAGMAAIGWYHEHAKRAVVTEDLHTQRRINDSTVAKLAVAEAANKSTQALILASKQLGGKPLAGFRILVPERHTVVVHDTLPTTRLVDSTRTASFEDSTFAGRIKGTVTAPPFPAALGVSYELFRPAFSPTVGFVERDGKAIAVVTWAGENVEIDAPFFRDRKQPRLNRTAQVAYDVLSQAPVVGGGVAFRVVGTYSAFAQTTWKIEVGQKPAFLLGVERRW